MQTAEAEDRVIELRRDQPEAGEVDTTTAAGEAPRGRKRSRTLLVSALAGAVALGGALWILARPSAESTDDAYLAADTTSVAPKVRGLVSEVLVRDNQTVRAGDPLVRIDAEEFDAKLASASADLADAEANLAAARAALVSQGAEERLTLAQIAATRTAIRSSSAEADHANADSRRFDALVATGAIARRDAESYRTAAVGAQQGAARAQAQLAVAREQADVTSARRPGLVAAVQQAEAARQRAAAALDLARQDQRNSLIRAPIAGTVGNRQARVGDYVQPGSRLLTLVPLHALYVTANFKETQTRDMRAGQPVTIDVDALGGEPLKGRVESFAPGSGSTFALLPFEPGTGNFTKIVQRVPVRIRLDPGQPGLNALRPGLSVTAKVRLSN
ncbi:HlyD family secretion protein [Novosphingobium sp. JCM 18896]|uniref:HlyD family secretion protein n=1 Tax=Novosphingobium sp. JCM 18896 TaxID=2989731 RepID=UPI002222C469|nr:HlyD family secretion protein [Novosphingobium sp. JCM 18896]MCW1431240.1 HlyD family secretion protein [Novosphingobium sp. JCM 18896]